MSQKIETFNNGRDGEPSDGVTAVESLITRLVDGEAGDDDRGRFESLAAREPGLWKRLAIAHQDMVALSQRVDRDLDGVEQIELPARKARGWGFRMIAPWTGWAAAAVLAFVFMMNMDQSQDARLANLYSSTAGGPKAAAGVESAEQHLREYLDAPFVLGEMPPELIDVQEMTDGRYALRILRQIEEVAFVASAEQVPVDDEGNLALPPEDLRRIAPAMELTN